MIYGYVSSKAVIGKYYRDLNKFSEEDIYNMIEWIGEALEHIGVYNQYCNRTIEFQLSDYRYLIPCDLVTVLQFSKDGFPLYYLSGTFDDYDDKKLTDTLQTNGKTGYIINGKWFNFNFNQGKLKLSYLALMLDEEGFPLIPDLASYKDACTSYIDYKVAYAEYRTKQMSQSMYYDIKNQWLIKCDQARGEGNMPDLAKIDEITRVSQQFLPDEHAYDDFFRSRRSLYYNNI